MTVHDLPTLNAALNSVATLLLLAGWVLIKRRQERAHKVVMLTAFATSVAFLVSYIVYHVFVGHVKFAGGPPVSYVYYSVLISHIILAVTVPFLAILTIYRGLRDQRARHRRIARWTFPIWLYVSVTGVVIYLMLYVLFPVAN